MLCALVRHFSEYGLPEQGEFEAKTTNLKSTLIWRSTYFKIANYFLIDKILYV